MGDLRLASLLEFFMNYGAKLTGSRMYSSSRLDPIADLDVTFPTGGRKETADKPLSDYDFILPTGDEKVIVDRLLSDYGITCRKCKFANGIHVNVTPPIDLIFLTPTSYKRWIEAEQAIMHIPLWYRSKGVFDTLLRKVYCPELFVDKCLTELSV